jgi:hypothetical protein
MRTCIKCLTRPRITTRAELVSNMPRRGPAARRMSERLDPEKPERDQIGARTGNGADRGMGSNLRRRGRRRGTRWPHDRGLPRIGESLSYSFQRAPLGESWSECSYRELSRFPDRHFWPGAHWPCLCPGAEIRGQDDDPHRSGAPRNSGCSSIERWPAREALDGWLRPALATGASTSRTSRISRGAESGTGLRPSRRASVETRRSFWSGLATLRAKPPSTSAASLQKFGC